MYIHNTNRRKTHLKNKNVVMTNSINLTLENQNYVDNFGLFLKSKLLNLMLKKLPLPEMHLNLLKNVPSENFENGSFNNTGKYSYCDPGKKIQKRLKERFQGKNILEKACRNMIYII